MDLAVNNSKEQDVINYLQEAMKSITRARSLTNQLLTFTKSGTPTKEITHINELIKTTVNFVLSGSVVTYKINFAEDLWYCLIDKNQIGQVLENIILNAIQSMPNKGNISIKTENIELKENEHITLQEGNYVRIIIRDNGSGMSEEILSHLFEPFFTTKNDGHGLGLATSYSIVKNHNGIIEVESELDKGSIFSIFLPATKNNPIETKKDLSINHHGKGLVLVLDDEEAIQNILEINLNFFGYSVITVAKGETLLEFINEPENRRHDVKFMILDLTIPGGLGGKDVINDIRNIYPSMPIFVLSGYAEDPIISKPQEFGFTASLKKPFTRKELESLLNQFIEIKIPAK